MFLNTAHWAQLTRDGIPAFVVWNQPLMVNGHLLQAGDRFPIEGTERAVRRLYDTNKITTDEKYYGRGITTQEPEPKPTEVKKNGRKKV